MSDEQFFSFLRYLMTMSEDDVSWVLAAATDTALNHARSTLLETLARVDREQARRV